MNRGTVKKIRDTAINIGQNSSDIVNIAEEVLLIMEHLGDDAVDALEGKLKHLELACKEARISIETGLSTEWTHEP
jgi:hypothetical protein